MFASRVARSHPKAPDVGSAARAPQHSRMSGSLSHGDEMPDRSPSPGSSDQAARGPSWDFSTTPVFADDASREAAPPHDDVRIRSDSGAVGFLHSAHAVAATVDRDTVFVHPAFRHARSVVSHELAHIAQLRSGRTASLAQAEAEATRAAKDERIAPQHPVGAPAAPMFLTVAEQIKAAKTKGEVFDILRALPPGTANSEDVTKALQERFGTEPDDLWLATQLQTHGPETLWDPKLMTERAQRAQAGHWAPEKGAIASDLTTPGEKESVRAVFFPGSDPDKRALVFAGVHQSEPEGSAVADELIARLSTDSAAGRPPAFTVIVVPNLFGDRTPAGKKVGSRTVGGIDPNRNFPGEVRPGVLGGSDTKTDVKGDPILAENRILMALVERFQPQRVASIHAHSLKSVQGDAPGIFVDPRADPAAAKQDVKLAEDMAGAVASGLKPSEVGSADPSVNPLIGNYAQFTKGDLAKHHGKQQVRAAGSPDVMYDPTAPKVAEIDPKTHKPKPTGISAGGWFPQESAMPSGSASPQRGAVAIYTVEVPEWRSGSEAKALPKIEQLEAQALEELLLGTPPRP